MRLLFVGDVVGKPGRRTLARRLSGLIDEHRVDYVVVNVDNVAGGFGVTPETLDEVLELPVDCLTAGNHVWDKREAAELLTREPRLLRPANYPEGNPGTGVHVGETATGIRVATIHLEGQVFMKDVESPFRTADRLLAELEDGVRVILVDFHAEATSEKQALGLYLDGRVSAVLGTHTHVPTADERVLPGGTAFQTDVGMTGPYEGVIGFRLERVLPRFLLQTPSSFEVAKRDVRLAATLLDVDEANGKARSIDRLLLADEEG